MELDNDGWLDIYDMNHYVDYDHNHALKNTGNGQFASWEEYGLDFIVSSMGFDVADLNDDGFMDIAIAGVFEIPIMVSANIAAWHNEDKMRGIIINGDDDRYTAWGTMLADFNNDGKVDMISSFAPAIAKDETPDEMQESVIEEPALQPDALWLQNADGMFEEVSTDWDMSQLDPITVVAVVDWNNHGWLDVFKSNIYGKTEYWQARCGAENWLKVRLRGAPGDPHGIGSRITIKHAGEQQTRWIHSMGRGFLVGLPYEAHFGLGQTATLDSLTVHWLDGRTSHYSQLTVDQTLVIQHPCCSQ